MDVSHITISNVEGQDFGGWEIKGGVTPKPEGGQWEWVDGRGGAGGGGMKMVVVREERKRVVSGSTIFGRSKERR